MVEISGVVVNPTPKAQPLCRSTDLSLGDWRNLPRDPIFFYQLEIVIAFGSEKSQSH